MIKVKLPILKKEIKDTKLVCTEIEKEFEVDTSIVAQTRYEINFPELAKSGDLFDYIDKLQKIDSVNLAVITSKLKVIYCLFDTDFTFLQFLKMFDFSVSGYTEKLIKKIKEVLDIALNSSSEKN